MGSHSIERTFLFDTGSNVIWFTSDICTEKPNNCDNKNSRPYRIEDSAFGKYYQDIKVGPDGGLTYYLKERENAGPAEIHYG